MKQQGQKGFTIIEVVLVLAIAGLIFLMVFIALPALQQGQRDTQRRSDVGRLRAQVNQFQANNQGRIPTYAEMSGNINTAGTFLNRYMKDSGGWIDPLSGNPYSLVASGATVANPGDWSYATSAKCNGESVVAISSPVSPRSYAVTIRLEGSGVLCQDNQ